MGNHCPMKGLGAGEREGITRCNKCVISQYKRSIHPFLSQFLEQIPTVALRVCGGEGRGGEKLHCKNVSPRKGLSSSLNQ